MVSATYDVEVVSTSTTYADTGLSATITPTLNTSKILVMVNQVHGIQRNGGYCGLGSRLFRGATFIYGDPTDAGYGFHAFYLNAAGSTQTGGWQTHPIIYLDSPATTSSTTYKTQFNIHDTSSSAYGWAQGGSGSYKHTSSMILLEIGA